MAEVLPELLVLLVGLALVLSRRRRLGSAAWLAGIGSALLSLGLVNYLAWALTMFQLFEDGDSVAIVRRMGLLANVGWVVNSTGMLLVVLSVFAGRSPRVAAVEPVADTAGATS
ncbi:hypothetical protein [Asanoa hainanensis]|uniref:hypothetical protein n=1 Tax=Asanoa hainanensis TaxID=560556 RepID=UPI000B78FCAE|nr:hypothetical protein [Asanoa hainanensis]